MSYCTNCGTETKTKICKSCGVKNGKTKNYCRYCGNEIDKNAIKCTNCNERIKIKKFSFILDMIFIVWFFIFVVLGISMDWVVVGTKFLVFILIHLLGLILSLPIFKVLIKKLTVRSFKIRRALDIGRYLLLIIVAIAGPYTIPYDISPDNTEFKVIENVAVNAAVEFFHDNIDLKNESSFVINDATIIVGDYDETGDYQYVTVYLDYSAQNGFGGYNRETQEIEMKFERSTGKYYLSNEIDFY